MANAARREFVDAIEVIPADTMPYKDRLHWIFLEFLKMETKYEAALQELSMLRAPARFLVDEETKKRVAMRNRNNATGPSRAGRIR